MVSSGTTIPLHKTAFSPLPLEHIYDYYYDNEKKSFGNLDFELSRLKNGMSRLCTNPLADPPPSTQYPNKVKKTEIRPKTCFTHVGWSF